MKKFLTLCSTLLFTFLLIAQNKPGKISGHVVNAENMPVEAVTIQLLFSVDKKVVKTEVTNKSGNYIFENLKDGTYILSISAVGFAKKISGLIELNNVSYSKEIAAIQLIVESKALQGVTVTATRPFIEQKIDRMVVNVDASPSNAGATALEVLEKSPGITVDNDGNISLKGKQGVIVMMDGKPTYLSAADLANILRNMPASGLDQIEIMTNPSSKYDASGNSGIINIKTKKSKTKGSNGSITLGSTESFFTYSDKTEVLHKPSISVNYNYKKNKINFFGNGVYNYREGRTSLDIYSKYYRDQKQIDSLNYVNTLFRSRNNNYTLKLGMDYQQNKNTMYGFVLNGFLFEARPSPTTQTTFSNLNGNIFSRLHSQTTNILSWKNFSTNFNYKHTFDTTGTEITLDLDYSHYNNITDQLLRTGFFDGNYDQTADSLFLRGHLPSAINIYSFKADFTHELGNGIHLESGLKSSYVKSDNLVDYQRLRNNMWIPDSRNNHFVYSENINAAYVNANKKFNKLDVLTGLRLENTNTKGVQELGNSTVKRNYVSLFPSLFLNYTADKKNVLTLSASRRLQRPNYQDLNPFTFFLDSLSYRQGNPFLTPQFSYNYELRHTYNGKLSTTLNYTNTTDVISQILNRKRGSNNEIIGFLTVDNIAKYTNIGIAISAPVKFAKWWNANLYTNVYRNHYIGTYITTETGESKIVPLDLAYTSFTVNINNNFIISKGWTGEWSGFYRFKTIEQLNLSSPMGQMSFGLAKNNLLKGKASLRINARDPFNWQRYEGHTKYGTIDIKVKSRGDSRQYGASFTYRFGKQQGQYRRRSSATEEEQQRVGATSN